ncbi:unnamed protein product [Schistosoma haematobium]|nr:unnamed protein product [Schistosoma haematobium]
MVWFKFYPSQLPIFAVCYALFLLPIGYLVVISNDHAQPFVPFLRTAYQCLEQHDFTKLNTICEVKKWN